MNDPFARTPPATPREHLGGEVREETPSTRDTHRNTDQRLVTKGHRYERSKDATNVAPGLTTSNKKQQHKNIKNIQKPSELWPILGVVGRFLVS